MKINLDALAEALDAMALKDPEVSTLSITEIEANPPEPEAIDVCFGRKGRYVVTVWADGLLSRDDTESDADPEEAELGDITAEAVRELGERYGYKVTKRGRTPALLARVVAPAVYHALKGNPK